MLQPSGVLAVYGTIGPKGVLLRGLKIMAFLSQPLYLFR